MAPNGYKAVTRYRDWDGKVRQVKRHGATKGAARRNLAAAIRDRSSGTSQIDINGEIGSTNRSCRRWGNSGCESFQLEWSTGISPQ